MADCEFRDFCLIFRAWIFDILWPLCEKAGQIISIVYLVQREQYKWAIMMSVAMAIPGFLEAVYWTSNCFCDKKTNFNRCCQWLFFFNPLLYPFTLVAWHVIVTCQGAEKFRTKFAMAKVLRSLQVQTESACVLLLQLHILAHTFQLDEDRTYVQIALAGMSLISLAKDSAEHHFHELNGKSRVPTTGQFFPTHIFYILQIALRLPTLALLTIYLGDWFGLFLVTMLPANFLLASLTLNTLTAKNVWTGLLSTMSPICFVSKEKIRDHLSYGKEFYAYYLWSSLGFFALTLAIHTLVNGLLYDTSSITAGYFFNNVKRIPLMAEHCTETVCGSVHIASCVAILASGIQIFIVFCVKRILFNVKFKSDEDTYSLSYLDGETSIL